MTMVTWCSASGRLVQKSQLFSAERRLVRGSRLTARLRSGNLWGSRMKKTGVLLPTMSRLPSSVYMRTAKPRLSRSASAAPRSPATGEKRMYRSVSLPTPLETAAVVYWLMSLVTVNLPKAPEPLACIRRAGMTSRSKWASFSKNQTSCRSIGPRGPAVAALSLSATGAPAAVVTGLVLSVVIFPYFLVDVRKNIVVEKARRRWLVGPLGIAGTAPRTSLQCCRFRSRVRSRRSKVWKSPDRRRRGSGRSRGTQRADGYHRSRAHSALRRLARRSDGQYGHRPEC